FQVLGDETALKPEDNRVKAIAKLYAELPDNPFLRPFFEHYRAAFHLTAARGAEPGAGQARTPDGSPFDAPSKALRSPFEASSSSSNSSSSSKQQQKHLELPLSSPDGDPPAAQKVTAQDLVELWNRTVTKLSKVQKLTDKRRKWAARRLK